MRFFLARENFLKLLKMVSGVTERKQISEKPVLASVLLKVAGNTITAIASDQEVEIVATMSLPTGDVIDGQIAVPFRKLNDICRSFADEAIIAVSLDKKKIILRYRRTRFSLSTFPVADFPVIENMGQMCSIQLKQQDLRCLMESTAFAMADQDVRYFLNGMLLEISPHSLRAVASDGHRLALQEHKFVGPKEPIKVIVPRKGVLAIFRTLEDVEDIVNITIDSKHIRFEHRNLIITTRLLDGKFPEYRQIVLDREEGSCVVGMRDVLKEAFYRAAALFSEKFRGVKLKITAGKLKILATTSAKDEIEEDVEIEYNGQEMEVGFNVRYLIDYLSVISCEKVKFTFLGANRGTLIKGVGCDNGMYILMPMRI